VFVLKLLDQEALTGILARAWSDSERGLGREPESIAPVALTAIAVFSNGDARIALNLLDQVAALLPADADGRRQLTPAALAGLIERRALLYDKSGEEHYNLISALHKSIRNSDADAASALIKSMRGSDPDAAIYWLARMLEAGEDPLYVARRLVRFASEDIGNADPRALEISLAAKDAVHFLGMPEANTALAQLVVYLSAAPKSNAVYEAYSRAAADAHGDVAQPVPLHLRNAPTKLMKDLAYGKGYQYAHDQAEAVADMTCLPPALEGRRYYEPTDRGIEVRIKEALAKARDSRRGARGPKPPAAKPEL
jgi:putative ATPase